MVMSGPIPGENLLQDKTNLPWHNPPEFTDISDCLDKVSEVLTKKGVAFRLLSLAEIGVPLYRIASLVIMDGVYEGKWTIDMAMLLIGPTTKILEIIADTFEIEYDIGIEDEEDDVPTGIFLQKQVDFQNKAKDQGVFKIVSQELPGIKQDAEAQEEGGEATEAEAPEADLQETGFMKMNSAGGM